MTGKERGEHRQQAVQGLANKERSNGYEVKRYMMRFGEVAEVMLRTWTGGKNVARSGHSHCAGTAAA